MFGEKQHSLELYDLLMEKTGLIHQDPINKHIHIFYKFLNLNSEGILKKQESLMETWTIEYSDKVTKKPTQIYKYLYVFVNELVTIYTSKQYNGIGNNTKTSNRNKHIQCLKL